MRVRMSTDDIVYGYIESVSNEKKTACGEVLPRTERNADTEGDMVYNGE